MEYKSAVPVVATEDVRAAVEYYIGVLGFREHFAFGDPPVYAGVEREGVLVYISLDAGLVGAMRSAGVHPEVFLWVKGVDGVYEEHRRRGARIVEEISDRPWDARQYVIEDPSGNRLKVAEPLDEVA